MREDVQNNSSCTTRTQERKQTCGAKDAVEQSGLRNQCTEAWDQSVLCIDSENKHYSTMISSSGGLMPRDKVGIVKRSVPCHRCGLPVEYYVDSKHKGRIVKLCGPCKRRDDGVMTGNGCSWNHSPMPSS